MLVSRIATKKIVQHELFSLQNTCRIMTDMLAKPHEHSIEEIDAALDLAANGAPIKEVAASLGLSQLMFAKLLQRDPVLAGRMRQARELGYITRAESLSTEAKLNTYGDVNHLRVVIDTEKWLLSKLHPAVFGDKIALQVETVDVSGALKEAKERAQIIDITPQAKQIPDPFAE